MSLPPLEIFDDIRRIHGHYCPMSTLGGRMGWAARQRLIVDGAEDGFRATVYSRTCALDGIAQTAGCDESSGTLVVEMTGEHRLDLRDENGVGVSVALSDSAMQIAWHYRQSRNALEQACESLSPVELEQREAELAAMLDDVLNKFRTQPDEELLSFVEFSSTMEG